jgi:uncharacterized protein
VRAVSDAGPLIHLSWIDHLFVLDQLYDTIAVSNDVRDEVLRSGDHVRGMALLRSFFAEQRIDVRRVPEGSVDLDDSSLRALHQGERSAIALMQALPGDILLIDDRPGRHAATRLGLPFMGTVGILRVSRDLGLLEQVHPLLLELRHFGFRISDAVLELIHQEEQRS